MPAKIVKAKIIAIVTTCADDWGGCEELWSKSIPFFQTAGFNVTVFKTKINRHHPRIVDLMNHGVKMVDIHDSPNRTFGYRALKFIGRRVYKKNLPDANKAEINPFLKKVADTGPELVIFSQSINFDGLEYADCCRLLNVPYVLISQKAVDFYWPPASGRAMMQKVFHHAVQCYFVSQHNLILTEEMFGIRLKNASIIFNPLRIDSIIPYPDDDRVFKLACVGRFFILDKGQDMLIRVLSHQKWKERNLIVSLIGYGDDEKALQDLTKLLDVHKILFEGYIEDIKSVCETHHAFVLPSRSEGLPLVIMEAMAAGRLVIATNAGGNAEILTDGISGYISEVNLKSLDEAMERAWQNRREWKKMGLAASNAIKNLVPKCPEEQFAKTLLKHLKVN